MRDVKNTSPVYQAALIAGTPTPSRRERGDDPIGIDDALEALVLAPERAAESARVRLAETCSP